MCATRSVCEEREAERRRGGRLRRWAGAAERGVPGAGALVPPRAWDCCPVAEPWSGKGCSGGVSSLGSPGDQRYAPDKRPVVSFEAFIPPPLPVAVLSVPPVPVDVGMHGREGGTRLNIALGILHRRKALW